MKIWKYDVFFVASLDPFRAIKLFNLEGFRAPIPQKTKILGCKIILVKTNKVLFTSNQNPLSNSSPKFKVQTSVLGLGLDFVFPLSQQQEQEQQEQEPPTKSGVWHWRPSLVFPPIFQLLSKVVLISEYQMKRKWAESLKWIKKLWLGCAKLITAWAIYPLSNSLS